MSCQCVEGEWCESCSPIHMVKEHNIKHTIALESKLKDAKDMLWNIFQKANEAHDADEWLLTIALDDYGIMKLVTEIEKIIKK